MLTTEEISALSADQMNAAMVDFVYGEVERRAADMLEIKKTCETKAAQFFGPSVSLAVALSGVAAAATHNGFSQWSAWGLLASAGAFIGAAVVFAKCQRQDQYVYLGLAATDALAEGWVLMPEQASAATSIEARVKLWLIARRVKDLADSVVSNAAKERFLKTGRRFMAAGAALAVAAFAWTVFVPI